MERYGLIGKTPSHSWSPAIHKKLGNPNYTLFGLAPEALPGFLAGGNFRGLNVTIPYKKEVLPYLSELSPRAKLLGSVNTILKCADGSLFGDNTDWDGFSYLLKHTGFDVSGKKVLVLGSGGASVTVQAVLQEAGAQVTVISRSGEDNYENLSRHAGARYIVNTTPVGMYPENGHAPLSLEDFPELDGVIDLIYNPARTALLMEAESLGIPAFNGLPMLIAQAAESSRIWGITNDPAAETERVLPQLIREKENIILIGMPGSGKTSMSRLLSYTLQRPVYDTDREIEKLIGIPIPNYIARRGEDAFRRVETKVLTRISAYSGVIVATGGGIVTREGNYPLMHQNGRIVWIRRNLNELTTEGRPLSQLVGVEALYEQRAPLYERFADCSVESQPKKEATMRRILDALK